MDPSEAFRRLHGAGLFVMPNPWDRGSARLLEEMGFPALATTSAGFGRTIGRDDRQVTRDELVAHVADLTDQIRVPLNVDSERLFPDDPGGIAECVRLLADAGAAGCSIEDYNPTTGAIDPIDLATSAVAEAAAVCADANLVLTARCENHLHGVDDVDDTVARLIKYRDAGAEVVYAPGLLAAEDISRVVDETGVPVNVLALRGTPTVAELALLGVRRVSLGSMLWNAAYGAMTDMAASFRDSV